MNFMFWYKNTGYWFENIPKICENKHLWFQEGAYYNTEGVSDWKRTRDKASKNIKGKTRPGCYYNELIQSPPEFPHTWIRHQVCHKHIHYQINNRETSDIIVHNLKKTIIEETKKTLKNNEKIKNLMRLETTDRRLSVRWIGLLIEDGEERVETDLEIVGAIRIIGEIHVGEGVGILVRVRHRQHQRELLEKTLDIKGQIKGQWWRRYHRS